MFLSVAANEKESAELRELRESTGMNVRQFADRIGIDYSKYRNYEYGQVKKIPAEVMHKARQVSASFPATANPNVLKSVRGLPMSKVRVIGRVAAGEGAADNDHIDDELYVPSTLANLGGSGWLVQGDSMMPLLEPGDVALFREFPQPRRGYPFLVQSPDGEYRVKVIDYDQGHWILKSLNRHYSDESLGHHRILGYLIGWYRVRGARETLDSDPNGLKIEFLEKI